MMEFAFCKVPVCPMRADHSDTSEMLSQLLFGEPVEVLEEFKQWKKVRTWFDQYTGWVDFKQLSRLREKELNRWLDGLGFEFSLTRKLHSPEGPMQIVRGSFVPAISENPFSIGGNTYSFDDEPTTHSGQLTEFALSYLNTPYLWGGKSPFGIDCSGFVQTVFRASDINLPRDASQQVNSGADVEFSDRQAGDLAFFKTEEGRVHHVGILISGQEIIHASGYVRVDDFSDQGIYRRTDGQLSHHLHSIKRM